MNFHADGGEFFGPHSDDQRQLRRGSPIVSVSWGVSRNFVMVPKKGTQASASLRRETLLLNDGDVVAMCGSCQATHKHAVPQMTRVRGLGCPSRSGSLTK